MDNAISIASAGAKELAGKLGPKEAMIVIGLGMAAWLGRDLIQLFRSAIDHGYEVEGHYDHSTKAGHFAIKRDVVAESL